MSEELLPEVDEEPEEDDEAKYSGADPTQFTATTGTEEYDAITLSTAAARRSPDANSSTRSFQGNWSVSAGEPASSARQ